MAEMPARPRLAPGVRLHFDKTRDAWVLLSPERVIEAEGPAHEILRRCDGSRTRGPDRRRTRGALRRRSRGDRGRRRGAAGANCTAKRLVRASRDARYLAPLGPAGGADASLPARLPVLLQPAGIWRRAPTSSTPRPGRACSREAAAMGVLQVHLSGGEPAARRDLVEITAAAHDAGLYTNLITSAIGVRSRAAARLAGGGAGSRAALDPGRGARDRPTGSPATAARTRASWRWRGRWSALGMALTVNAVIHRANIARVAAMVEPASALGAGRVEVAHAQYYGWALRNRAALMPTREQVDAAMAEVERMRPRLRRAARDRPRGARLLRAAGRSPAWAAGGGGR